MEEKKASKLDWDTQNIFDFKWKKKDTQTNDKG